MTTTVGGIVRAALRKIGVLAAGEPLPAGDEGGDALEAFQFMVDAWSTESLLIPVVSEVIGDLVATVSEYTIGIYPGTPPVPEAHFETPRPEKILSSFIRDASGTDYPQEIIDTTTYSWISRKSNASRPSRFYVREGWPLNTILFESVPYADEFLHLEVIQPLNGILPGLSLTEEINLPPGYKQALIYNLAIELAPEWGKDPKSTVVAIAVDGKRRLKRNNFRSIVLGMDRALATRRKGIGTYIIEQGP